MPTLSEMLPSNYLQKADVPAPQLVTITGVDQVELKGESGNETKWAMRFAEFSKPLVLNKINMETAAEACGSVRSEEWIDRRVVIYTDANVYFGGKKVGGLRLRAQKKAAPKAQPEPALAGAGGGVANMDDDIPF